jgi:tetratricopeptide (TPR) repeat protein
MEFFSNPYFLLLAAYGVAMTAAFYYAPQVRDRKLVHLGHVVVFFVLAFFMWRQEFKPVEAGAGMPPLLFLTGFLMSVVCLLLSGYVFIYMVRFYVEHAQTTLMSDHQLKVPKTYDKAEAAERRMDYETAAALYKIEIEDDPEDGEACRRLAEVYIKVGDFRSALSQFNRAIECNLERDRKCAVLMRMADLHAGYLGDIDAAIDTLQTIIHQYPTSKHADYAKVRLRTLDEKREQPHKPQQTQQS